MKKKLIIITLLIAVSSLNAQDKSCFKGCCKSFLVSIGMLFQGNALFDSIDDLIEFDPPFIDVTYHREEHVYKDRGNGLLELKVIKTKA